jgi:hypothetical protein
VATGDERDRLLLGSLLRGNDERSGAVPSARGSRALSARHGES